MRFHFRKSIKLFPGVRLNMNQRGISISVGAKGFRFSQRIYKGPVLLLLLMCLAIPALVTRNPEIKEIFLTTAESVTNASLEQATVIKVSDGDTITVRIVGEDEDKKVRFIGVDTPESVHPDSDKNTVFGEMASDYTKGRLGVGQVVYMTKDKSDTDRYGRLLRFVWLEQPEAPNNEREIREKMYNAELLLQGYAVAKSYSPDTTLSKLFAEFQKEAEQNQAGLWKQNGF